MKMIVVFLLYLSAVTVSAKKIPAFNLRDGQQHFDDFVDVYNKVYTSDEEKAIRYGIFLQNLEEINALNERNEYAEFGVNEFSDLTLDEFLRSYTCFKDNRQELKECNSVTQESTGNIGGLRIPDELDWRTKNVVTRVKNQGTCGACWAFSTVGNVESINAIKTGQLLELSEQQLVDCDKEDQGCNGGLPETALQYFIEQGAMPSESYPYEGADSSCRYDAGKVAVNVTGCVKISGSEDHIAEQLATIGPLSIAIDATNLKHYTAGVLDGPCCQGDEVNHAVLLVGYGVDSESGLSYWLVKNSWGEQFRNQGYFMMRRGVNCLKFLSYTPVSAVIN